MDTCPALATIDLGHDHARDLEEREGQADAKNGTLLRDLRCFCEFSVNERATTVGDHSFDAPQVDVQEPGELRQGLEVWVLQQAILEGFVVR